MEGNSNNNWNRSFSEPDLIDPFKSLQRFVIKHPHEYIAVDDLKYFRRKKDIGNSVGYHTRSNICLDDTNVPVLPSYSEYRNKFGILVLSPRPTLLRRATSLRLEGLMFCQSEHQEQYHWYTPEDWKLSRTYPIKNPESIRLGDDSNMNPEYRSSYISHPIGDRTTKILPREMFRIDPEPNTHKLNAKEIERSAEEVAAINKLAEDKLKRDLAIQNQQKCHLQSRTAVARTETMPSEYKRQYVQFPIEKAHSIPQISHFKMQGDFFGIPEYQDSFKMYANYSKSAPIKKNDNLRMSGAEVQATPIAQTEIPEYQEKYNDPPKNQLKAKSLKMHDNLLPNGNFTKDIPEYYESFKDPQIKELPERGKPREPYLRLKGKLEFNPEYRNTYLDFPRSRPIVRKPASSFRLPISSTASGTAHNEQKQQKPHTPRRKYKSTSPKRLAVDESTDLTVTPEYRRANYSYQIRERTPTRKITGLETVPKTRNSTRTKLHITPDTSIDLPDKYTPANKRRPSRYRDPSILETHTGIEMQKNFENISEKKAAKFGRRASVLQNAANCREKSSIIEGNPKFAPQRRAKKNEVENQESFVVLDEPCKRSNWMKKSWYES